MQQFEPPSPPRWAEKLLAWLAADHLLEEVQGDLQELFEKRLQAHGLFKAKVYYVLDLLKLIHPRLWKTNPRPAALPLNPFDMLAHYLLISYRTFLRFKGSFFINLIGLSTGITCALLLFLWVKDELGVDKFHEKDPQLYQVMTNWKEPGGGIRTDESIPGPLCQALLQEMPDVENAAAVVPFREGNEKGIISFGNKHIKAIDYFVDKNFFQVFSYPVVEGNAAALSTHKYSILLSDELASKLFPGMQNSIGKTVEWKKDEFTGTYLIAGIFKKPPPNSTAQFDIVFNLDLYREKRPHVTKWTNGGTRTYILLKKEVLVSAFEEKITSYLQSQTSDTHQSLFIRPYSDKYLYDSYENGVQSGGRIEYVRLFSLIAFFIVLIACINFMNLSTAKASVRMKEIGIKKAIGAQRKSLIFQFLAESTLMALLAVLLAVLLILLLLPHFNEFTGKLLSIKPDSQLLFVLLAVVLVTGLLSGSYPALYLSQFKPAKVLKGKLSSSFTELLTRKGLVVFQFTVSIILIVSMLVFYKQIEFIQSKHLGYDKENVILFKKEGKLANDAQSFLQELKNIPGVVQASSLWGNMTKIPNTTADLTWEGKNADAAISFGEIQIDYDLIEALDIKLKDGRSFSRMFGSEDKKIIFNEAAIVAMGLKDPVGKTIKLWGEDRQIIGVVKNFHVESLYEPLKPSFLNLTPHTNTIVVRMKAGTQQQALEKLIRIYGQYNPGIAFEFEYMDQENFQKLYTAENRVALLSRYFAGVAIVISCLGLLGLAAFTAQRRRKEIGIRKVLGSGDLGIVRLLSAEFMQMVFAAILLGLPISYVIARQWLNEFAYQTDLEWWFFAAAGLIALLIAGLTIATQTLQAARINPIQTLRDE